MLSLLSVEEIESRLLMIPGLVRKFAVSDPELPYEINVWMTGVEKLLSDARVPEVSGISSCRAELLMELRHGRKIRRKDAEENAMKLLNRAASILADVISVRRSQLNDAERVMMQIVSAAKAMGLIPAIAPSSPGTVNVRPILDKLSNHRDLASLMAPVKAYLGAADSLIVLGRCLTRLGEYSGAIQ